MLYRVEKGNSKFNFYLDYVSIYIEIFYYERGIFFKIVGRKFIDFE